MSQIVVVDTGGQYCHLIARRVRELGVHAEVCAPNKIPLRVGSVKGVIISGGPRSVNGVDAIRCPQELFDGDLPVLGICYGHQLLAKSLGGTVRTSGQREFSEAVLQIVSQDTILQGLNNSETVWMSHGDEVLSVPPGFEVLARTANCKVATMVNRQRTKFGLQFHPEVADTPCGLDIFRNFVFRVCGCECDWDVRSQIPMLMDGIREQVGYRNVLFFVSGGVDSTVAFTLCAEALGAERVLGVFVDTGFMRKGDKEALEAIVQDHGWQNIRFIDAADMFMSSLEGLCDPEHKRQVIGDCFLRVQQQVSAHLGLSPNEWMFGQGTIYPDTIESGGTANSALIKTHHNRVTAIEKLIDEGLVVEPLISFYKDEVRTIGEEIGLPHDVIAKHPFPGPGLAVRCLCSHENLRVGMPEELQRYLSPFELKAWSVPLRTVGVQGDYRSYSNLIVLYGKADLETYGKVAISITNEVAGTNRVAFLVGVKDSLKNNVPSVHATHLDPGRVELLREADAIVNSMMEKERLTDGIWQFPVVLLPLAFGSGETIALRPVRSLDAMTAKFAGLPAKFVQRVGDRLIAINGIDAVIYDVTNKPPATIEWE